MSVDGCGLCLPLRRIEEVEIDPRFLIPRKMRPEDGPDAYTMFQEKNDGCIKAVIHP